MPVPVPVPVPEPDTRDGGLLKSPSDQVTGDVAILRPFSPSSTPRHAT